MLRCVEGSLHKICTPTSIISIFSFVRLKCTLYVNINCKH
jgi:hypothetical protein